MFELLSRLIASCESRLEAKLKLVYLVVSELLDAVTAVIRTLSDIIVEMSASRLIQRGIAIQVESIRNEQQVFRQEMTIALTDVHNNFAEVISRLREIQNSLIVELADKLNLHVEGQETNMKVVMLDAQTALLTIAPTSKSGKPATVTDQNWQVSNPNVLSMTVADDKLSATVISDGDAGDATVTVGAKNAAGADVAPESQDFTVQIVADRLNLTVGAPTDVAPAQPASA